MEAQVKASQEDSDRLRAERDRLRYRLSELQTKLSEREAEVRISDRYRRSTVALIEEACGKIKGRRGRHSQKSQTRQD